MSSPTSDAFLRDIIPAPGVRVEIRGAEWVVKRVDATSTGGHSILVAGISELVRGREARFHLFGRVGRGRQPTRMARRRAGTLPVDKLSAVRRIVALPGDWP